MINPCKPLFALALLGAALSTARAVDAWADQQYQYRVPLSVSNPSFHAFAAGDIVAATIPSGVLSGKRRADGADVAVYRDGVQLPSRTLFMGGSDKVLFALPEALPAGGSVSGLYVYAGAPSIATPPDAPAGLQVFDFSDGGLHGWKSLQAPDDVNSVSSDIRTVQVISDVPVLAADTGRYHHPVIFADGMTPVGDATVYASFRTRGGNNEVSLLQRFNTQTLTDNNGQAYLTGADQAAVGLGVDAFGEQRILISSPLGGAEGADGRRHPGPSPLTNGVSYAASPDNNQFVVSATRSGARGTEVTGKAWQAAWPFTVSADPDPSPGGFQTTANVSGGALPPGKAAFMLYGTSVFVHWVAVAPNGYAESVSTATGELETSPDPEPGQAVVYGLVYNAHRGPSYPVEGATVTVRDATNATLADFTTDSTGRYRAVLPASDAPAALTVEVTHPDGAGAEDVSVQQGASYAVDVPLVWTGHATGTVTDADGNPVPGATVGLFLDQGPFVTTDAQGHYDLPVPAGTSVIGAHKDGALLSGPRWLTPAAGAIAADFTLFPDGDSILRSLTPDISPAGGNASAVTDGNFSSVWAAGDAEISPSNPLRITWNLSDANISQVEVHWKNVPTAWRVEMANLITDDRGGNPRLDSRVYYAAGDDAPPESGGYLVPGTEDHHVTVIKTAPVWGVRTLSIVVTGAPAEGPPSLYEVTASEPQDTTLMDAARVMSIASGLRPIPTDPNAFIRWNTDNDDQVLTIRDALELARDPMREVKPLRVLTINYLPVIEAEGGRTVRQIFGWYDPYSQTEQHRRDMELASHEFLRIHLLPQIDVDGYTWFSNGFRFTDDTYTNAWRTNTFPAGSTDYPTIIREFDLERRVAVGDVDAVWIQAPPGFAMPETIMAGANAYWCNSSPVPGDNGNRLFVFTNFNYERHTDVMIHDWGHRSESILGGKVYGGWNSQSGRTTFDRFTRYDKITPGQATAGNTHWPPNADADYDYGNTRSVYSDADDWLKYPNLTGARKTVSRSNWAIPRKTPQGQIDYQRNFLIWWFSRFPHVPGIAPDGKQANWWKYVADMNRYPESR